MDQVQGIFEHAFVVAPGSRYALPRAAYALRYACMRTRSISAQHVKPWASSRLLQIRRFRKKGVFQRLDRTKPHSHGPTADAIGTCSSPV
ncbi:hypothetical protein [Xanthomonas fragariae]|uniref:hypothetical protein n=1 Tax=Xanthomonas fragariae TaxID=48664 RepID=UPI001ABDF308|nr:hypothetical protein [Xanthomonas fragariae]UKR53817.1 hypothetical protein K4A87_08265 [Xanthomonas fragariae]